MYLFESSVSTRNNIDRQKKILVVDEECVDQKKRKWEWEWEPKSDGEVLNLYQSKGSKSSNETTEEVAKVDVELHLETPLPADWKQCLHLQPRQNHFYNTTTRRRRSKYSRQSWEIFPVPPQESSTAPSTPMSLELELNLPDGSSRPLKRSKFGTQCSTDTNNPRTVGGSKAKSLSWVCLAKDEEQSEMLATVCMRCHMLVMLCKSSPCCPNCKFTHQICL